ncbi:MAG: hypothetical protein QOF21_3168 [Actinomycetota bacterium]
MRSVALVCCVALFVAGCGDNDRRTDASSTSATVTSTTDAAAEIPHMLLEADGWRLTEATDKPIPGDDVFHIAWSLTYQHSPTPNQTIPAVLAVAKPSAGRAREAAPLLIAEPAEVRVSGMSGYAGEEHSPADDHLIATHVVWDRDDYVAIFTVYDTNQEEALKLAQHVAVVSNDRWKAATATVTR